MEDAGFIPKSGLKSGVCWLAASIVQNYVVTVSKLQLSLSCSLSLYFSLLQQKRIKNVKDLPCRRAVRKLCAVSPLCDVKCLESVGHLVQTSA